MSIRDTSLPCRRAVLRGALSLALVLATAAEVRAQQKAAKNIVNYQEKPHGDQECAKCLHFLPPDSCKLVASKISPNGWCSLFAPKPK